MQNTVGPLCASLGGVEAWCRAVVGGEPWREGDPGCLPIPWREVEVPEKLCFGECGAARQACRDDGNDNDDGDGHPAIGNGDGFVPVLVAVLPRKVKIVVQSAPR